MILVTHYPETPGMEIIPSIDPINPVRVIRPSIKSRPAIAKGTEPVSVANLCKTAGYAVINQYTSASWRIKDNNARIRKFKRWARVSKAVRALGTPPPIEEEADTAAAHIQDQAIKMLVESSHRRSVSSVPTTCSVLEHVRMCWEDAEEEAAIILFKQGYFMDDTYHTHTL